MDIEGINLLKKFNPGDEYTERIKSAIEHLLAEREEDKKRIAELEAKLEFYQWGDLDNLKFEEYMKEFIAKQKVKEELEKAEKENEPYEQHNKESRMYWINEGKINLAKKLLEDK